jgi:SAM-dependent methyltransferase
MSKIEQQKKHFESISNRYYNARRSSNHLLLKKILWNYFFKDKEFLRKENLKVLEPMCGYGEGKKIIESNISREINYEGFDYSEILVKKIKEIEPDLNIYVMDVTKFKPKGKYDIVILIGGLHHVPDYAEDVIKKVYECLEDDGYFINYEPTQDNSIMRTVRNIIYRRNNLFDDQTERAFELRDLNQLFSRSGFHISDQIHPGLLSYILYYNPDAFPYLNIGGNSMVRLTFALDKLFFRNYIGRKLSFTTLTVLQKKISFKDTYH